MPCAWSMMVRSLMRRFMDIQEMLHTVSLFHAGRALRGGRCVCEILLALGVNHDLNKVTVFTNGYAAFSKPRAGIGAYGAFVLWVRVYDNLRAFRAKLGQSLCNIARAVARI